MTRHVISAVATFVLLAGSVAAVADSHIRIVRLSSVEGQVQMDRATGEGLERAILNTPVVEGTRLVTGSDGLAEVEFENQSALRLTEDSEVKFSQLLMNDAGVKINQIQVIKGLVYLDAATKSDDVYRLMVGNNSFLVRRDTEMRLSAGPDQVQVAVFKGEVQLENQPQPVIVGKRETLTLAADNSTKYTVAKGVEPVRFDGWNKEREAYSSTYAENQGYGGPSHAYGLQDLNYYGNYFYAGGYGYVLAALRLRQRNDELESLQQWSLDVLSRLRLFVGLGLSLGMAAISLWLVGFHQRNGMGMVARQQLRWPVVCVQLPERASG
jgi:hypothetical protein